MSQQDQINADVATIKEAVTGISADVTAVAAFIQSLQASQQSGTPLDLTALDAVAGLATAAKTALDALVPAPAAPATTPA